MRLHFVFLLFLGLFVPVSKSEAQIVPDSNFAQAIRIVCPDCIDSTNKLLPAAANLKILNVSEKNIRSLAGLEGFAGLEQLICNANQLTSLPELPTTLEWLFCNSNKITQLPKLPESLQLLWCAGNELEIIPPLPTSLMRLICGSNKLKALPENLPATLHLIDCSRNQITHLPQMDHIPYLRFLYCNDNQLKQLPELSPLFTLKCANNQLKSLPRLPDFIRELDCSNNQISFFSNLPRGGILLNLSSNQLTCLPTIHVEYLAKLTIDADKIKCLPNDLGTIVVTNREGVQIPTPPVCQENLTHAKGNLVADTYVATKKIESAALLLEGTTRYHTTQSITLNPGFSTATTTTFVAELRTCN